MSRLSIVAAVALLAAVSVSPKAEASGFEDTFGTFELRFGSAIELDDGFAIPAEGEISDSGGGPWTGSVSGSLVFSRGTGPCDYVGEWTIVRENAAPLVERVKGTLEECEGVVVAGIPHLVGSSRAQSAENGKIVGFRSFDGVLAPAFDAASGTWNGRFRTD